MSTSDAGFIAAVEEAEAGYNEGGVPIGACLVDKHGKILGRGHNMRVQKACWGPRYDHRTILTLIRALPLCTPRFLL